MKKSTKNTIRSSVDRLFDEPFEPLWMRWQRESLRDAIVVDANYKYQLAAAKSRARIVSRCDGKGNYQNENFTGPRKRKNKSVD